MLSQWWKCGITYFSAKPINETQKVTLNLLILMLFTACLNQSNSSDNKKLLLKDAYKRYVMERIKAREYSRPMTHSQFAQQMIEEIDALCVALKNKLYTSSILTIKKSGEQLLIEIDSNNQNFIDVRNSLLSLYLNEEVKITFRDDDVQLNGEKFEVEKRCKDYFEKVEICSIS